MAPGMRGDATAIFRERQKGPLVSGGSVRFFTAEPWGN
jgi:hypothetical protein